MKLSDIQLDKVYFVKKIISFHWRYESDDTDGDNDIHWSHAHDCFIFPLKIEKKDDHIQCFTFNIKRIGAGIAEVNNGGLPCSILFYDSDKINLISELKKFHDNNGTLVNTIYSLNEIHDMFFECPTSTLNMNHLMATERDRLSFEMHNLEKKVEEQLRLDRLKSDDHQLYLKEVRQ